jgi:hypothetical protein
VPARVYTTTFIRHTGAGTVLKWTVPSGYRAVVKSVVAMAYTTPGDVWAAIADVPFWWHSLQAKNSAIANLTTVAYAGETVEGYTGATGVRIHVSGYLFQEGAALANRYLEERRVEEIWVPSGDWVAAE